MDVDYNSVDAGGQLDPLTEHLRRMGIDPAVLARLPVVGLAGTVAAQQAPQPSRVPAASLGGPSSTAQPNPTTPVVPFSNQPTSKQPVMHDSDTLPPHKRFLDVKDRGVQKAIAAGQTPPTSDAGKALYAAGVFDQPTQTDDEGKSTGTPAVKLTPSANSSNEAAQGDTPQSADLASNAARMLAAGRAGGGANTSGSGGAQTQSIEDQYRDLLKTEPTREQFPAAPTSNLRKFLAVVAGTASGAVNPALGVDLGRRIWTAPQREAEEKFRKAERQFVGNAANLMRMANLRHQDTEDRNLQSEIDARDRGKPQTQRPENLDREAYDYYVGQGMTPADARKRVLQDAQSVKPERTTHTSPFEAFAYGDPKERKAAQDFLDMEKRLGSRYKNPSEFEEKYRLFKEDPETYKAMFGDKSGTAPDRRTATSMLNYFDKRRKEVNGDFTLDDDQKKQQLQEIENLERPFLDAVQPNAANGNDRVTVTHPDGRTGTIPRSQLGAAKKKGYREAQSQ
jgi:hypothetical protein